VKLTQGKLLPMAAAALAALAMLAGCAGTIAQPSPAPRADLLSGATLFGAPVPEAVANDADVLDIDAAMRAFVAAQVGDSRNPELKLRKLLAGMGEQGLFSLDYVGTETKTVRQTFADRKGNCLSFTMLFVALAREAGLDVSYQMVEIPPVWTSDSDLVILNNHINARVRLRSAGDYEVDFNNVEAKGNYSRHEVDDDYALALYHSNLGVQHLQAREQRSSFIELRAAIRAYPEIAGPWVNLGVLYAHQGLHELAESAYLEALRIDPRNLSALSNLAGLNESLGRTERAEYYFARVRAYQARNPYYYFALANTAYEEQRFDDALAQIGRAIRLKHDEHQFYFLRGLVHYRLGRREAARGDFAEARSYAEYDDVKRRYAAKIAALTGA
jgi:tetratricopeptide (TPR) repeat protein